METKDFLSEDEPFRAEGVDCFRKKKKKTDSGHGDLWFFSFETTPP